MTALTDKTFAQAPSLTIVGPRTLGDLIARPMASKIIVLERENAKLKSDVERLTRLLTQRSTSDAMHRSFRCLAEVQWRAAAKA